MIGSWNFRIFSKWLFKNFQEIWKEKLIFWCAYKKLKFNSNIDVCSPCSGGSSKKNTEFDYLYYFYIFWGHGASRQGTPCNTTRSGRDGYVHTTHDCRKVLQRLLNSFSKKFVTYGSTHWHFLDEWCRHNDGWDGEKGEKIKQNKYS